jgi:hypothetical protein
MPLKHELEHKNLVHSKQNLTEKEQIWLVFNLKSFEINERLNEGSKFWLLHPLTQSSERLMKKTLEPKWN